MKACRNLIMLSGANQLPGVAPVHTPVSCSLLLPRMFKQSAEVLILIGSCLKFCCQFCIHSTARLIDFSHDTLSQCRPLDRQQLPKGCDGWLRVASPSQTGCCK